MSAPLAFVDCETTGLDPHVHDVWEIAVILEGPDELPAEHVLHVRPNLETADPVALDICRYHERTAPEAAEVGRGVEWLDKPSVAEWLVVNLKGRHMIGAVPDFDARFLEEFIEENLDEGRAVPLEHRRPWHYHLVDVENLAAGYLAHQYLHTAAQPPYKSDELAEALGIRIADEDRHTALGDARWARAIYRAIAHPIGG